jgi:2'-5' RNA ligase
MRPSGPDVLLDMRHRPHGSCDSPRVGTIRPMDMVTPTETALVIPVPQLDGFVSEWRPRADRVAPAGLPAHITVMYPFVPPEQVDTAALSSFFATEIGFAYELDSVGRFGDEVVFLRPVPDAPFRAMISRVSGRWGLSPYGGEHPDPVPHLTIGYRADTVDMRAVADAADQLLPVNAEASEVLLLEGSSDTGIWSVADRFGLKA